MAYVNIHDIPGLTFTISYWNGGTEITSPTHPLSYSSGHYSLPGSQTEWDRVLFEITDFAGAVLPITGRISVVNAEVVGPYDGAIGIFYGPTWGSVFSQETIPPDAAFTGNEAALMDTTNRYFLFGHNSGSGPDVTSLASLIMELDGDFASPEFWTDFEGTFEDDTLQRPFESEFVPEVVGQDGQPQVTQCHTVPDPPPGPTPGGLSSGGDVGSGPPPLEVEYPLCLVLRDDDYPGGFKYCCREVEGGPITCREIDP